MTVHKKGCDLRCFSVYGCCLLNGVTVNAISIIWLSIDCAYYRAELLD